MTARIFRPARTAMQSGKGNTKRWVLEFEPAVPRFQEPLMGWTGSSDMRRQVRLRFDTSEEAIAYAEREGIAYKLNEPTEKRSRSKSYSDNFSPSRKMMWTH